MTDTRYYIIRNGFGEDDPHYVLAEVPAVEDAINPEAGLASMWRASLVTREEAMSNPAQAEAIERWEAGNDEAARLEHNKALAAVMEEDRQTLEARKERGDRNGEPPEGGAE